MNNNRDRQKSANYIEELQNIYKRDQFQDCPSIKISSELTKKLRMHTQAKQQPISEFQPESSFSYDLRTNQKEKSFSELIHDEILQMHQANMDQNTNSSIELKVKVYQDQLQNYQNFVQQQREFLNYQQVFLIIKEYFDKIKENFQKTYQDHLEKNNILKQTLQQKQQELSLYEQNKEKILQLTEQFELENKNLINKLQQKQKM